MRRALLLLLLAAPAGAREGDWDKDERAQIEAARRKAAGEKEQAGAEADAAYRAGGYLDASGRFFAMPPALRGKAAPIYDAGARDVVGFLGRNPKGSWYEHTVYDLDGAKVGYLAEGLSPSLLDPIDFIQIGQAAAKAGGLAVRLARAAFGAGTRAGTKSLWAGTKGVAPANLDQLRGVHARIHGAEDEAEPTAKELACGEDAPRAHLAAAIERCLGPAPERSKEEGRIVLRDKTASTELTLSRGGCFWVRDTAAKSWRNFLDADGMPVAVNAFEGGRQRLKTRAEYLSQTLLREDGEAR